MSFVWAVIHHGKSKDLFQSKVVGVFNQVTVDKDKKQAFLEDSVFVDPHYWEYWYKYPEREESLTIHRIGLQPARCSRKFKTVAAGIVPSWMDNLQGEKFHSVGKVSHWTLEWD